MIKRKHRSIAQWKLREPSFSCFVVIHSRYRRWQTDDRRHTDNGGTLQCSFMSRWLGGVLVRTLDFRLSRRWFEAMVMTLLGYFWDRWSSLAGKVSSDVTTTSVNSTLYIFGVATLCDRIWYVISRIGVVISITNCLLYFIVLYIQTVPKWTKDKLFRFVYETPN